MSTTSPLSPTGKTLKFQARKQKTQPTVTASSFLPAAPADTPFSNNSNGVQSSAAINSNVVPMNILQQDKRSYLAKLQEENDSLLELLKEIHSSKSELVKRVRELELARDTILASRGGGVSIDAIDTYLTHHCSLAEKNRYALNLRDDQAQKAKEIYNKMFTSLARFRLNQTELQEFMLRSFNEISDLYVNERYAEASRALEKVEFVVSANPRNIAAAEDLSKNLEKSLIAAASEKFTNILKEEMSKQQLVKSSQAADGYSESKIEAANNANEMKQILTQNEQLRATVADLRQKIAKIRVGSGSAQQSSSSPRKPGRDESISSKRRELEDDIEDFDIEELEGVAGESVDLPAILNIYLKDKLKAHTLKLLEGHPLALQFTPEAHEFLAEQVALDAQPNASISFVSVLRSMNKAEVQSMLDKGDSLSEEDLRDRSLQALLQESMNQLVRLASVHSEVTALSMMFLSYMRERLNISSPSVEASLPSPQVAPQPASKRLTSTPAAAATATTTTPAPASSNNSFGGFNTPNTTNQNADKRQSINKNSTLQTSANRRQSFEPSSTTSLLEDGPSPYFFLNGDGDDDNFAGFPRQKSPPKANLPRYMQPKSKASDK